MQKLWGLKFDAEKDDLRSANKRLYKPWIGKFF